MKDAIREALAERLADWGSDIYELQAGEIAAAKADMRAAAAILATLAQPAEPAAYRHLHDDGWEYYDAPTGEDCQGCQALYTAPPAQQPAEPVAEIEALRAERDALARACVIARQCIDAAHNDHWASFDSLSDDFDDAVRAARTGGGK